MDNLTHYSLVENKYSIPLFDKQSGYHMFQCPDVGHSTVFNEEMMVVLHTITAYFDCHVITGSAVLLETQRTANQIIDFQPGDLDIFLPMPRDKSKYIKNIVQTLATKGVKCTILDDVHTVLCPDIENSEKSHDFGYYSTMYLGNGLKISRIVTMHIDKHPSIQLILVSTSDFYHENSKFATQRFQKNVLKSFDINICSGMYNINDRTVTFPSDPDIFWFVYNQAFYSDHKRSGSSMLQRVSKYRNRGFRHLGYWNKSSRLAHVLHCDIIKYAGLEGNANCIFLPYVKPLTDDEKESGRFLMDGVPPKGHQQGHLEAHFILQHSSSSEDTDST